MAQQRRKNTTNGELPDECWNLIFNRLGRHYRFEDISLVCKHLYFVSSRLRPNLTIYDPSILSNCDLAKLFTRFNKLVRIDFKCFINRPEYSGILSVISQSGLDIEELNIWNLIGVDVIKILGVKLNKLRIFRSEFSVLTCKELVELASLLPELEEFDIGNGGSDVSDDGIKVLSSSVKRLRKVDLLKYQLVSDESLFALSMNCKFLTELVVGSFDGTTCNLTENGIGFALRNCKTLKSICLHGIKLASGDSSGSSCSGPSTLLYSIANSISHAKTLCEIELRYMVVTDELLCSIAKAKIPLSKLVIWHCSSFTYSGLRVLLHAYQSSIRHLRLGSLGFLTDDLISDLSMFLSNLTHLEISSCDQLTDPTFFIIASKCTSLNVLKLESLSLGSGGYCNLEQTRNQNITSLELINNEDSIDESIKAFCLVCPNLKLLNLKGSTDIYENSVGQVLKSCSKLTDLELDYCVGSRILGTGSDISRLSLEILKLSGTSITDSGMGIIAARCRDLLKLELKSCPDVTTHGVIEVLVNCIKLRELNLWLCRKVRPDIVTWMASIRPSLRKIFPPGGLIPDEEQTNLILRHGCVVCND